MTSAPNDADHYSYRVTWSPEDDEFVATCTEFPSLSWLAETPDSALAGIRDVVARVLDDLSANGEDVPEPLATRSFSGKFNLRVGADLHRRLVTEAAEHRVSLNQYVVRKLDAAS